MYCQCLQKRWRDERPVAGGADEVIEIIVLSQYKRIRVVEIAEKVIDEWLLS